MYQSYRRKKKIGFKIYWGFYSHQRGPANVEVCVIERYFNYV